MSIFNLSEFTIRRHANAKSFQRGEAYYAAGAVISLIQRGNWLQAEVQGLESQPAYVSVYGDEEGVNCLSCTCNCDLEDWCKHIVCTLLTCLRAPERIEQRPSLSQLLEPLDYRQTQRLIQELVAENPHLIDVIEEHINWIAKYPEYRPCTSLAVNVDVEMFQQQVYQILQDGVNNWQAGEEEDPITEKLLSLVEIALDYNHRGEGIEAIAILSAITSSCVDNWQQVAEYGFDQDANRSRIKFSLV